MAKDPYPEHMYAVAGVDEPIHLVPIGYGGDAECSENVFAERFSWTVYLPSDRRMAEVCKVCRAKVAKEKR